MKPSIRHKRITASFGEFEIFRIENKSGTFVELSSLGAGILSINVPDKNGVIGNVALSYADPADYMNDGPCMGKIPGRVANRISKGRFLIDGICYQLNLNDGLNSLHGGPSGFQNRIWKAQVIEDGVRFSYLSKDGEENYPGNLEVTAEYHWSEDNILTLELKAQTDKPTIVNLTNHVYFNLDGADNGEILNHRLKLKASRFLPTDKEFLPTGEKKDVRGTPMDFLEFKELWKDLRSTHPQVQIARGYNHCWLTDDWKKGNLMKEVAILESTQSGRCLKIDTTMPGMQIYTGGWLEGSPLNRSGRSYKNHEGVALEMQGLTDAPNHQDFPSQILRPGELYSETIRFCFTVNIS